MKELIDQICFQTVYFSAKTSKIRCYSARNKEWPVIGGIM